MKNPTLRRYFGGVSSATGGCSDVGVSKKRPRSTAGTTAPLVQLFIDAGQREIDYVTCKDCAMAYAIGIPEDETLHRIHHQRATLRNKPSPPPAFAGWTKERLLVRFSEPLGSQQHRVICVRQGDPIAHLRKVQLIHDQVAQQLGTDLSQPLGDAAALLCIYGKAVVGLVVAERIAEARPVTMDSETKSLHFSSEPSHRLDAKRGVRLVWVHPDFRRRGIATRLVDLARAKVPRSLCAFTTPTESGFQFALKYIGDGTKTVPVYMSPLNED